MLIGENLEYIASKSWNLSSTFVKEGKFLFRQMDNSRVSFPEGINAGLEDLELESSWNKYRVNIVRHILTKYDIDMVLEVGSGDGNIAIPLGTSRKWVCVEPDIQGARKTSSAGIETYNALFGHLQIPSDTIPCIGLFDVLEHIEQQSQFLQELKNAIKSGGYLVITVPAMPSLFSLFDYAVKHFRRYSSNDLRQVLQSQSFRVIELRYIFSFLVVPRYISKIMQSRTISTENSYNTLFEKKRKHRVLNLLLNKQVAKVLQSIEKRTHVPFGLTLICIAQKVET